MKAKEEIISEAHMETPMPKRVLKAFFRACIAAEQSLIKSEAMSSHATVHAPITRTVVSCAYEA